MYTIDKSVESPIMLVDNSIGLDENGQGIDGSLFQRELMSLDGLGKKSIQCWINSPGGNVYQGWMMVNAILKSKTPVDTYNIGMVASMGFPIFMAGRKRIMMDYAVAMIHMPFNREDPEEQDAGIEAMCESMVKMVASRSKISEKKVRAMLEAETWLTADECLKYGFCTEVERTAESNKKYMPTVAQTKDVHLFWNQSKRIAANLLLNNSNHKKTYSMLKITTKLGLNEAATEDNVVEAIKTIEAKSTAAEVKVIDLENKHNQAMSALKVQAAADVKAATDAKAEAETKLTTVQASLTAKENEYTALKTKYDAMEAEKKTAEDAQKKMQAEALVTAHAKSGRIKNEKAVIDEWVALAIANYDGTKKIMDALPLNKEAAKIEVLTDITEEAQKMVASAEYKMLMIANRNKQKAQA